jgi:hypothetical protein
MITLIDVDQLTKDGILKIHTYISKFSLIFVCDYETLLFFDVLEFLTTMSGCINRCHRSKNSFVI